MLKKRTNVKQWNVNCGKMSNSQMLIAAKRRMLNVFFCWHLTPSLPTQVGMIRSDLAFYFMPGAALNP
jgi:hypothetical protein